MRNILKLSVLLAGAAVPQGVAEVPRQPISYRAPAKLPDAAEALSPSAIHLDGFLGRRVSNNEKNRLLRIDPEPLLAGFRHKPGSHPWIGEHIGKWLHAATLAWSYTGDPELRAKMDSVVAELIKAQEPDGYLGTYTPDKRFGLYQNADWDVWSHKYDLLGLLTYYHYTASAPALEACRRIGNLLINTFGPDKKSILKAGTHVGMAATSALEPIVLLYRHTGDERFLEFARYIVQSWDEPKGPRIIAALLETKAVNRTANGKAYEMLSNLVGLCELARATGDRALLPPVINAWEDIVAHRLYITGSASQREHFGDDYYLPNQPAANVSETCVTTTWIQLNSQLLRLTGHARYGAQLERTLLNHLAAAQRPDGAQWCYFTALEGTKPYGPGINCCVSSGPRGMALAPQQAYLKFAATADRAEEIAVNLFEASRVETVLDGQVVTIEQQTDFPLSGLIRFLVHARQPARFGLRVRAPEWSGSLKLAVNGAPVGSTQRRDGWVCLPARRWQEGDRVALELSLSARRIEGDHGNSGRASLAWGPFILAFDSHSNADLPAPAQLALVAEPGQPPFVPIDAAGQHQPFVTPVTKVGQPPSMPANASGLPLAFSAKVLSTLEAQPRLATFVPFAEAGSNGGHYQVWLRTPGSGMLKDDRLSR